MDTDYRVWKNPELAQNFLEGVRGAVPLASVQIDLLLRLIQLTQSQVDCFLDLGCGNGILGQALYQSYPHAQGFFVDLAPTMLKAAEKNLQQAYPQSQFILSDFGQREWVKEWAERPAFDVIISGFAIHHQRDERKQALYAEIFGLLKPGGIFLNLEHVASLSILGERGFDELFVDSLYAFHHQQGSQQTRAEIDQAYYNRPDKVANILAPVEIQCDWLRAIGFEEVDCFLKIFELALFGGIKPSAFKG